MRKRQVFGKKVIALGCAAVMAGSLTGCSAFDNPYGYSSFGYGYAQPTADSTRMALDEEQMVEMDLTDFHSDENGYSFYNVKWGSTAEETEEQLGYSLGAGESMSVGAVTCYKPTEAAKLLLGRVCSRVELTYDYEGELYGVTYEYNAGDDMEADGLDVFAEEIVDKLTELYGESKVNETVSQLRTGSMYSTIYKWEEEIEGDQISSLQVAVSNMGDQTELVIVGVICYDKEEAEEATTENEAEKAAE